MKKLLFLLLTACCLLAQPLCAQYTRMTDLPTLYIETFDGQSITSKTVYKYCRLHYVDEQDLVTSYDSVSIRGRGNSTWNMSKKPYKIKFLNKERFLGSQRAKAKKWTLLANAGDKTLMRNALTSALGAFTSLKFNPAAKFVDVVLNNVYQGNYQISDQIDVRKGRVDISEQPYPLTQDDNTTGGYLLEVDGFRDGNCFTSAHYQAPIRIHYPEDDEIAASQTTYIKNYINQTFERALNATYFADAERGYRAYVDTLSLIDWYICTEVSANLDGFYSTYFYKEKDNPRLFWGPLWDYDIAYNNDYRVQSEKGQNSSVRTLMADIGYNGSRAWVNRMWQDPWFQRTVYHRYEQLLDAGLVEYMQAKVDSLQALLSQSQQLNYEKWGISRRMYHEVVLYSSYDQYVSDLKDFIYQHCDYLLEAFANRKPDEPTPPFELGAYYYHLINAKTSKAIDLQGNALVQLTINPASEQQDWMIRQVGDHYQLINRATGLALNDPTTGSVGPTTNVGTQLNTATPDASSRRQLWTFVPQGTEGYYNLLNAYTQHIANLNGGNTADYTPILSYTNDSRNGESTNRLWRIKPHSALPADLAGIDPVAEPDEYALAYNPQTQTLHFASATPAALHAFTASIHAASGRLAGRFRADSEYDATHLPAGLYIVSWQAGGHQRTAKFVKK